MIKTFDNKIHIVGDDLKNTLGKNSKLAVASSLFSIYGFESLKKELNRIENLRFIFTDPTFIKTDNEKKNSKYFTLHQTNIEKSISGTAFEIHLKNELKGRTIAKECRAWVEQKVKFKSNRGKNSIQPMLIVDNNEEKSIYLGMDEFSSAGFGYKKDDSALRLINKIEDNTTTKEFLKNFNSVWSDETILKDITPEVIAYIDTLYKENAPDFIYYLILRFNENFGCLKT